MKLKRFLVRYHPPALILEFTRSNGQVDSKTIDLHNINAGTDVKALANEIISKEPLISENLY